MRTWTRCSERARRQQLAGDAARPLGANDDKPAKADDAPTQASVWDGDDAAALDKRQ